MKPLLSDRNINFYQEEEETGFEKELTKYKSDFEQFQSTAQGVISNYTWLHKEAEEDLGEIKSQYFQKEVADKK